MPLALGEIREKGTSQTYTSNFNGLDSGRSGKRGTPQTYTSNFNGWDPSNVVNLHGKPQGELGHGISVQGARRPEGLGFGARPRELGHGACPQELHPGSPAREARPGVRPGVRPTGARPTGARPRELGQRGSARRARSGEPPLMINTHPPLLPTIAHPGE